MTAKAARKEQTDAREALSRSTAAEAAAGDAFHEAEREGFPKE
jgi:hypothetical protein